LTHGSNGGGLTISQKGYTENEEGFEKPRWPLAYATPWPHLHVQSLRDCENCNARLRAQSCCCCRRAADVAAVNNIAQRLALRKFVSSVRDCRTMAQAHSIEVFAIAGAEKRRPQFSILYG